MKKLFFISYGGGHVQILLRVLGEIDRHFPGQFSTVIVGLTSAAAELHKAGYSAKRFCDYVNPTTDARAIAVGEKLAKDMHTEGAGVEYRESVAYLGLSMWDLIERVGESQAWRLLRQVEATGLNKRNTFCPVSVLERIIRRENPDAVITTNSPRSERAALAAAQRLQIPALRIEDLFGVPSDIPYLKMRLNSDATKIVIPVRPNRVAGMNELTCKNILANQSKGELYIEPQNVRVTGQPVIDEAAALARTFSKHDCRLEFELPLDRPVFLWATDKLPTDRVIFEALQQVFARRPEWFLLVKLHPGFSPSLKASYEQKQLPNVRVIGAGNIHRLIVAADAVLTYLSTVGVETIALGRPLVLAEIGAQAEIVQNDPLARLMYDTMFPHIRQGAAKVVSDLGQLEPAIEAALSGPSGPGINATFLNTDGKSARRIVELIKELVA
jgi:hypothetical protein